MICFIIFMTFNMFAMADIRTEKAIHGKLNLNLFILNLYDKKLFIV